MSKQPFLGRLRELKAFRAALSDVIEADNDLPYVFLLYGQGGMGKTKLAKEFRKVVRKEARGEVEVFAIDWQERRRLSPSLLQVNREEIDPGDVLKLIYQEILKQEGWGKKFDDFEKALDRFKQAKEDAQRKREHDYQGFGEVMGKGLAGAAGMVVPGAVYEHGKDAIEYVAKEAFSRGARSAERLSRKVGRRWRREDYLADLSNELEVMTRALARGFQSLSEKKPVVVFFDTYEIIDRCDTWVRAVIKHAGEQLIWVIGGRNNLVKTQKWGDEYFEGYGADDEEYFYLEEYNLRELTRRYIKEYFDAQAAERPPLQESEIERVQAATLGIPLAVATAVEIYAETGNLADLTSGNQIEGDDVVTTMVNRYMLHCLDQEQDQLDLYTLALANGDEALLHLLLERPGNLGENETVQARVNYLERSFAAVSRNKLQLHQEVRDFVIKQLFQRRKDPRIQGLNQLVVDHLQVQVETIAHDFPDLKAQYKDDDWLQLTQQWLRHLLLQDESLAWRTFLPYFLNARLHHKPASHSLIQLFQQYRSQLSSRLQPKLKAYQQQEDEHASLKEQLAFCDFILQDLSTQFRDHGQLKPWQAVLYTRQGRLCFNKQEYDKGLTYAQQAADLAPQMTEVWFLFSDLYRLKKAFDQAIVASQKALELEPDRPGFHNQLGLAYEYAREYDQALNCYQKVLELDPKVANAWENIGDVLRAKKQYNAAIEAYQKAVDLDPEDAGLHHSLGGGYEAAERYEEALRSYQKAIELDPRLVYVWGDIGGVYRAQKKYDAAIKAYKAGLTLEPEYANWHNNLGIGYRHAKRYEEALVSSRKALEIRPDFPNAWVNLGNVYKDQKKYDAAIEAFEKAVEIEPEEAQWYNNLGLGYEAAKRYEEALATYQKAVTIDSKLAYIWANIGDVYRALNQYDEAIKAYQTCVEIEPNDAGWYNNLGVGYKGAKRYEEALNCYKRALEIRPNYALALSNLGKLYQEQEAYQAAIEAYQQAITFDSTVPRWHNWLGICYEELKYYDQALESYLAATNLDPNYYYAWGNIGDIYLAIQKNEEAISAYQKALALDQNNAKRHNKLGLAYMNAQLFDQALPCYKQALELDPQASYVWDNIGDNHLLQEAYKEAIFAYQKAIELAPEDQYYHHSIGWCYLNMLELDLAHQYLSKAFQLSNETYILPPMNLGHIALMQGNQDEALSLYHRSVSLGYDLTEFLEDMEKDYVDLQLESHGITPEAYQTLLAAIRQQATNG